MTNEHDARIDELLELVEQYKAGMESRTVIGKALGIIMERLDLDDEAAWTYLTRCSQLQNRKVVELAAAIVETRELPDSASSRSA